MRISLIAVFLLMCVAQWFVPVKTIVDYEDALAHGAVVRLETEPVDPADPFRGRYVTLTFEESQYPDSTGLDAGDAVFVRFINGDDGFARIAGVSRVRPDSGVYTKAHIAYRNAKSIHLRYPFSRFYMEESKAPRAEQRYQEAARDSTQVTYAVLRIKGDIATIEDVMVNDRSLVELVREASAHE